MTTKTNPLKADTDDDGLSDGQEVKTYKTDPLNPDTDGDRLKDGPEVLEWKTDPFNKDTDGDLLMDGEEVHDHRTDPLDKDTDDGGIEDGHEVIDDHTNPLDGRDDLVKRDIRVEFDYDSAKIRSFEKDDLDFVIRLMKADAGATATIEGHADKRPKSKRDYNLKLSERRAQSVIDYISQNGGIEKSRMKPKGYGFDRPIAPNDTEENMQRNRRVEIYIRRSR